MFRTTRWMVVCTVLSACGQVKSADEPRARVPAPPVAARAEAEPVAAPDRTPLGERLSREASEHPDAVDLVDAQLTAFGAAGVQVTRSRQVLAGALTAHYCKTGLTSAGLGFSVCAFASQAEAEAGQRRSRARFDSLIPGRTLLVHGSALLVITRPVSAAAEHERGLLRDRFLHPHGTARAAL
ncbi:MAG TPA: hypothetical protein VFZ61_12065 [Polyangiales bacterium]